MTRPIFGKMKTIVLPTPESGTTYSVEGYKDEFGIDLAEYIILENSEINLAFPDNALILLDCSRDDMGEKIYGLKTGLVPVTDASITKYISGSSDGTTIVGIFIPGEEVVVGLGLRGDKDDALSIENIEIFNAVV